jgi:RIO kinase 1
MNTHTGYQSHQENNQGNDRERDQDHRPDERRDERSGQRGGDSASGPAAHAPDTAPPPARRPPDESTAHDKASYESNADVQRWLREHALDGLDETDEEGGEPEFAPTFLAHQRDRFWVLSSLAHFYHEALITDVLSVVKSGKEATVYRCVAHPSTGVEYLAAKVYRPRMFRSLRNDAVYRENRPLRDETGRLVGESRRRRASARKGERGRAAQITSWITYEYETQCLLYDAGADVPRPLAQIGNSLLMEYIGSEGAAAPLLREAEITRTEAQPLYERILRNVELFLACDRIHGDLSAYNILYDDGAATIIDFAQAVDARAHGDVYPLLARDVERVCRFFARLGVEADASALAADLWTRYLYGEL